MASKTRLYLIGALALAVLVAICLWIFVPKVIGGSNNNPRLEFIPMPDDNADNTLIRLKPTDRERDPKKWTNKLMEFLDRYYRSHMITKNIVRCSYHDPPKNNSICDVHVREWGPCTPENYFSYQRDSPCVFLKINRINGWVPDYYNDTTALPDNMPKQLIDYITFNVTKPEERNTVWITCSGENPVDVELLGPVKYHSPIQGLPGYYFPYRNQDEYLDPVIPVQFARPTTNVVINIECRVWAKNIHYNKKDGSGLVHFELLIE